MPENGGIPVENPATGETIATVPEFGADEVRGMVAAARAAQREARQLRARAASRRHRLRALQHQLGVELALILRRAHSSSARVSRAVATSILLSRLPRWRRHSLRAAKTLTSRRSMETSASLSTAAKAAASG